MAQYDEKMASQVELWKSELADLDKEEKGILGTYQKNNTTTVKTDTPKMVTIDGKKYKDGDIVTKNGKQFKVKVK
jgi:hypothetical protein